MFDVRKRIVSILRYLLILNVFLNDLTTSITWRHDYNCQLTLLMVISPTPIVHTDVNMYYENDLATVNATGVLSKPVELITFPMRARYVSLQVFISLRKFYV